MGITMTTKHGAPDWANVAPLKVVHPLFDLGEIVVRLGSMNTYDRRGYVVFMEDFRRGTSGWDLGTAGTGGDRYLDTTSGRFGPYSLVLQAGSDGARNAFAKRYLQLPVLTRMGLEFHHTYSNVMDRVEYHLIVYTGSQRYMWAVRYDHSNGKLQVRTGLLTWEDITSLTLPYEDFRMFGSTKYVADFETEEYDRILFNDQAYDASGYSPYKIADSIAPHGEIHLFVYSKTTFNAKVRVGGCILTQDEP